MFLVLTDVVHRCGRLAEETPWMSARRRNIPSSLCLGEKWTLHFSLRFVFATLGDSYIVSNS